MIEVKCLTCSKSLLRSPSKVEPRNYCSRKCYEETRTKELKTVGKKFHYKKGHKMNPGSHYRKLALLLKNDGHPKWKGEDVSYRGLHQWVRRNKGKPTRCLHCSKISEKPRIIQWANIDGRYRRRLEDYIALCVSCHKLHDNSMRATRGAPSATQL